ncbi:hypothetical protein SAMN06295960_2715 [Paenibacillus aquistagni]|uniref:Uncharacterized protein n=1 Tax=Paenibacillus aquistagni TaxID=1852522 RepID=A0A1X7KUG7_9BACL|nr:hypothetical protein SAMN06295960_2715 [Paenibacillus aquistagni]
MITYVCIGILLLFLGYLCIRALTIHKHTPLPDDLDKQLLHAFNKEGDGR